MTQSGLLAIKSGEQEKIIIEIECIMSGGAEETIPIDKLSVEW